MELRGHRIEFRRLRTRTKIPNNHNLFDILSYFFIYSFLEAMQKLASSLSKNELSYFETKLKLFNRNRFMAVPFITNLSPKKNE